MDDREVGGEFTRKAQQGGGRAEALGGLDFEFGTKLARQPSRAALEDIMASGQFSQKRADAPAASEAIDAIMDSVETITARREAAGR